MPDQQLTDTTLSLPPSSLSEDPEFLAGLESILAPMRAKGASEEEIADVTRRARTFYLQSKASNAEIPASISTTSETTPAPPSAADSSNDISVSPTSISQSPSTTSTAPPYPLSFAALASLIASGAPIPGIRDIPNKLAEGEPSVSVVEVNKFKKPWERDSGKVEDGVVGSEVA